MHAITTDAATRIARRARVVGSVLMVLAGLLLGSATTAHADLSFDHVGFRLTQAPVPKLDDFGNPILKGFYPDGRPYFEMVRGPFERQAGSHPDLEVHFSLPLDPATNLPAESVHDVNVDLPAGFVGDPSAVSECTLTQLSNVGQAWSACPLASQVGMANGITASVTGNGLEPLIAPVGLFSIEHGPDVPARFGFNYQGNVVLIDAGVLPGDYRITSKSRSIQQALSIKSFDITLWGVPADPSHDTSRQTANNPITGAAVATEAPRRPFFRAPTSCSDNPVSFGMSGDSWEHRGAFTSETRTLDEDGTPFVFDGCEHLPFKPAITVQALSHTADAPSSVAVDLQVPQNNDPDGLGTADVRRVKMTFPEGMSVSPSSAAGLGACAPAQISLKSNDAPTCPSSARLGSVTIDTPLLPDPLVGDVILATQNDNPFGSLVALYIAAKGPGFWVKLPGKIDLDQTTGRITATFDNTPQLPFSRMRVAFQGGSQAPMATPDRCGTFYTHVEITSWASSTPVSSDSPMTINQNCGPKALAPSFTAGTTNPMAGQYSPFTFTATRLDGMPAIQQVTSVLPAGLLADIGSVPQCDPVPANAGFCPAESRIGSTSVLSGPGAAPLPLKGNVYLTGPYKDAPFGLSIAVPTAGQAGPFDLGVVVVRAGLYVDRTDAHVTVKTDPLPTIIQGIPLRLRQLNVTMDRPKFMFNPTSCEPQTIFANFQALGGGSSDQTAILHPGGCGDLDLNQKLSFKLKGKNSTKDGTSPSVDATLTDIGGGANLDKVEVKLPLALALEPENAQDLCKPEERVALKCPKGSIVGTATARSVLPHPLTGPVYFVEGLRKDKRGRTVKTLPKLWIPLSGDGVTIDVNADSAVDSIDRLVTTFHDIPDAPIKSFRMKINGGKHGILVVSGQSTCKRDMSVYTRYTGQNKQVKVSTVKTSVEGCKARVKSTKTTSKSVTLRMANVGAGKLSVSGGGLLSSTSRTLKAGPEASISAKLTSKARAALRRHGKVAVKVRVAFRPKGGKAVTMTQRVTVRR